MKIAAERWWAAWWQVALPPEPASPALLRRRLRMTSSSLSFFPGGDGPDSCEPRLGLLFTVSWRSTRITAGSDATTNPTVTLGQVHNPNCQVQKT